MRVINFGCAWNDTGLQLGLMTNITTVHDKLAPAVALVLGPETCSGN